MVLLIIQPLNSNAVSYNSLYTNSVTTDYTPTLVELLCHLGDDIAMVAVRLLIDSAHMMNTILNDEHLGECTVYGIAGYYCEVQLFCETAEIAFSIKFL